MKYSELEEGEAGCIDLNDDDNNSSTIDPDVALSYIDEKLQDVLGHFQKDFEGGVSAENLGAKFGGYGSFLPAYQRFPPWHHPRTPSEYSHHGSRSIDNGQLQNAQTYSLYSSPDIISSNSATELRPAVRNDQKIDRVHPLPNHGKELTSKSELPNSTNLSDQKSLKVRIKVGKKDDMLTQKYADIYSGLGLEISPSSSQNESPVVSEGLHDDLLDIPDESLSHILQIMTSASLSGRLLLSPLSDKVICLTEKEWITGEIEPKVNDTLKQGSSRAIADGYDLKLTGRKMLHGNKPNLIEQSSVSASPTHNNKYISHASSVVAKKETDTGTLSYQELISGTMKLPLLSDSDGTDFTRNNVKSKIESKVSAKGQVKSDTFSDAVEKKAPDLVASFENGRANKNTKKSNVSGKVVGRRKAKPSHENLAYHKRDVNCVDEGDELALKSGEHVGQDEISVRADTFHNSQQTVIEKKLVYDEDSLELLCNEAQLSSRCEDRANGQQSIVDQDVMYLDDGILNKSFKSHRSKTSAEGLGKDVNGYKVVDADLEPEKNKNNTMSEEMQSIQTDEGSGLLQKRSLDNISKEKSMGEKSEDLSPLDRRVLESNMPRHAEEGDPNPDAVATAEAPLVNEDWVLCDKCHKWRILPLGTNPTSLPKKWVCTMLDWLPGMNHCNISQDDTTLALRAAQSCTTGSKHNQRPLSCLNMSVVTSGDARKSNDDHQRSALIETTEVKNNHSAKDIAKGTNHEKSMFVRNSKKRHHGSTTTKSLNDIGNSPSINDFGYHHAGQTASLLEGRYGEENQIIPLQNYSDKDDILNSKLKSKKDNKVDGKRASKKIKTVDTALKDENYTSDKRLCNIALGKSGDVSDRVRNSIVGLKNLSGSSGRPEVLNSVSSEERKVNDILKYDVSDMCLPGAEKTERHESEEMIQKKARVAISEGKECKRKKTDYSGSSRKVSRGIKDILGHDIGQMQPSVAATSSSSKVSSSFLSKAFLNEMKDSPIKSVSSSPLRAGGVERFSHAERDITTNHDFQDTGFFVLASPRTSSHDEPIFDINQTGKMISDENKTVTSPCVSVQDLNNCSVNSPDQGMRNARQIETLGQSQNVSQHFSHSKKAGKGVSSRSKEKKQVSRSVGDIGKGNHFDLIDVPLNEEKRKAGSKQSQGMFNVSRNRTDKDHVSKKDYAAGECKEEIPMKVTGISEKGKSNTKPPCLKGQNESTPNLQPNVELKKENDKCLNENDESKALKHPKRPEKPNANQQTSSRNSNSTIRKGRNVGESTDSSSQAVTNAVKEGKDLKHLADRLKNSGSTESTGLYFQAALKFLHGACLLESCSSESGKQTKIQSMEMYSSTAKLCEFCAHEYEKSRDMLAAALAYKCVEVAYMRVIYTSHTGVNKVRNEIQTALQLIPTGDSPCSSASDIDNLNNAAIVVDKAIASKSVGSPQVAGTQILTARNRSSCLHLIRFAQEVSLAMEASRKSRSRLGESPNKEGISSVKRALDFNFQDVDGLLHLVRVAMEAINR